MKDMGIVYGNGEQAKEVVVGLDTVYVHTGIEKVETDSRGKPVEDMYRYHEKQYTKNEYLDLMMQENSSLRQQVTDTQVALCELYESIGG